MVGRTREPSFVELFTPKLVTVLRERYGLADLSADAVAGLTVAIVALPLSMAIAIASGVTPRPGALHRDRRRVPGLGAGRQPLPDRRAGRRLHRAGGGDGRARTASTGCILATLLSGLILLAVGFLRLGTFIKYIPYPVTVGFTAGIAVIIFASQLKELLGLTLDGREPGPIIPKLAALGEALPTVNPAAVAVAALAIGVIVAVRRFRPHWPAFLIAVAFACASLACAAGPAGRDHRHAGSAAFPQSLPAPQLPDVSLDKVIGRAAGRALVRAAGRHREPALGRGRRQHDRAPPPLELRAGGAGGGQHRLGAVRRHLRHRHHRPHRHQCPRRRARPGGGHAALRCSCCCSCSWRRRWLATSRSRRSPAVLAVVAWNMAEKHEFATLLRASRGDAVVLLVTFLLVVFRDLTEGILVGFGLGALLFLHRMAQAVEVENVPVR